MSQREDLTTVIGARVTPKGILENLSQQEVSKLLDRGQGGLYPLFRQCALAVLNCGSNSDDAKLLFDTYRDFDIRIERQPWGIKLKLANAPGSAFVDGQMIRGVREHLFAVLRDIVYTYNEVVPRFDFQDGSSITNAVFSILRNARVLDHKGKPDLVVCWGGHSIPRHEYEYTKDVGYELGLRGLDVCTGCGPGAMKGPMKGATIGHSKQRKRDGRYVGLTEPGIIAAEPPNPIVNHLLILPDIEKRLEAFVRLGHGIIVFPGGAGTAEEILYLLGILLDPANADQPLPLVFTGPVESRGYFEHLDRFIRATLGDEAAGRYRIIVGDPAEAAREMCRGMERVLGQRRASGDAYNYNWTLRVPPDFQQPFEVSHESMASLVLSRDLPIHELAANLRRAFSGIVSGNVKAHGLKLVAEQGPFTLRGDASMATLLDDLLAAFVAQGRMKLFGEYRPCYRIVA
ncbi:MAG: nucleotide 5'-monophosphate nucleosidase PpnN [Steroidobacteraceae bacterium]